MIDRDRESELPFSGEYLDFAQVSKDELQTRIFELLTLVETSRELLRAQDADDGARRILLSVIGVLGASSAAVLRRDPRSESMSLLVHSGLDLEERVELPLPAALAEAFEQEGEPRPFRVDDDLTGGPARSFLYSYVDILERLEAAVVCPLTGRQGLFGFIVLGRRLLSEGYSAKDLEVFASLAELYVLALERGASPAPLLHPPSPQVPVEVSRALAELRQRHPPLREILGESEAMLRLFGDMVQLANSRVTVLIQGESGTGKEVVARAIHRLSPRREGPLEIVDCSSIPRELIESELFGHVRGAFTGAVRDRRGAFELAHRGTLFLDEIGEMTLASQTRLLRALQEGRFRPVGGEKTRSVDVRVIAASNVDLREAVARGEFRKDLFYRIQVYPLRLPPLRERRGDIEILTRAFLKRFYADFGMNEPPIDPEVLAALRHHSFPGNVRELQNMVEALAIRSRQQRRVTLEHLHEVFESQQLPGRPSIPGEGAHPRKGRVLPEGKTPREGGRAREGDEEALRRKGPWEGDEETPRRKGTREGDEETPRRKGPWEGDETPGAQILRVWRQCGFNLLEASRQLADERRRGRQVLVTDRAQMNHYLDGETLAAFLETGELQATIDRLCGQARPRHRVALRTQRVLGHALQALREDRLEASFPRLPRAYRPVIEALQGKGLSWFQTHLER